MDGGARACESRLVDPKLFAAHLRAVERFFAPDEGASAEAYARQVEMWRQRDGEREEVCSTGDATGGWLFLRLCARYGLQPYRRRRQKPTTVTVRAPQGFVTKVLWPQFQEMMKVFATARAETDKEILASWLGAEEASATLSIEERDEEK